MAKDTVAKSISTKLHKVAKPLRKHTAAAVVNEPKKKQHSIPQKIASEIDDIFSAKAKKQSKTAECDTEIPAEIKIKKLKKEVDLPRKNKTHGIVASSRGSIASPNPSFERIDADSGLKVYKAHLLTDDGEGGGTALCPFDCDCCF